MAESRVKVGNRVLGATYSLLTVILLLGMLYASRGALMGRVSDVCIRFIGAGLGEDLLTEAEVGLILEREIGDQLFHLPLRDLDLQSIEYSLKKEQLVARARVFVSGQRRLYVEIEQRRPILRVMAMSGEQYYVDATGSKMPLSKHFTARVPIVTGDVGNYLTDFLTADNSLHRAFRLVEAVAADDVLSAWLTGVHVQANQDLYLTGMLGDFRVIVGDVMGLDDKLARLKVFLRDGLTHTGWRNLEYINLKYEGQVVAKRRTEA